MEDSSNKESSTQNPKWIDDLVSKLDEAARKKGFRAVLKDLEHPRLILNPPKSLVEKMRKAKQEEAAKKKK